MKSARALPRLLLPFVMTVLLATGCPNGSGTDDPGDPDNPNPPAGMPVAQWARTVTASPAPGATTFNDVAVDSAGNVYAVGYQTNGSYTYGPGVTATTGGLGNAFAVIVKYDSAGVAQWARTVTKTGDDFSESSVFNGVAISPSGSIFVVGRQNGTSKYTYSDFLSVTGKNEVNAVIIRYSSAGIAMSGKAVEVRDVTNTTPMSSSTFNDVTVDSAGVVYAVGHVSGTFFGDTVRTANFVPVTVSCPKSVNGNSVIVKYDAALSAQWARGVEVTGNNGSGFYGVSADATGNVYAAGYQDYSRIYKYGTSVSATSTSSYRNAVIVKYDANGNALFARTVSGGTAASYFYGVASDSSGHVFAAGYKIDGTVTYASGFSSSTTNIAAVLVGYDSSLQITSLNVPSGSSPSYFYGVAVDSLGNAYAAGYQGYYTLTYGSGVALTGPSPGRYATLLKYDSSGSVKWGQTVTAKDPSESSAGCQYNAVAVSGSGAIHAAGFQGSTTAFTYGPGVSAAGIVFMDPNVLLVKYE